MLEHQSQATRQLATAPAERPSPSAAAERKVQKREPDSVVRAELLCESKRKHAGRHGAGLSLEPDDDDDSGDEPIAGRHDEEKDAERSLMHAFAELGVDDSNRDHESEGEGEAPVTMHVSDDEKDGKEERTSTRKDKRGGHHGKSVGRQHH